MERVAPADWELKRQKQRTRVLAWDWRDGLEPKRDKKLLVPMLAVEMDGGGFELGMERQQKPLLVRLDPGLHRGAEALVVVLAAVAPEVGESAGAVGAAEVGVLLAEEEASFLSA